jgi:hypothetical protein
MRNIKSAREETATHTHKRGIQTPKEREYRVTLAKRTLPSLEDEYFLVFWHLRERFSEDTGASAEV